MLSGQVHDIYAADVVYHQSCYIKFCINPISSESEESSDEKGLKQKDALEHFLLCIKVKIIRQQDAFLLHTLLADLQAFYQKFDVEPEITKTYRLKLRLVEEFGDQMSFFSNVKIYHCPCFLR